MSRSQKSEFNKRLALFFFDPQFDEDAYYKKYRQYYPGEEPPAYSPLYRLRKEMQFLVDKEMWLSAMLLPSIIIEGLVTNIFKYSSIGQSKSAYDQFYKKYFNFRGLEGAITRLYRNAQEHNFGMPLIRANKKGRGEIEFQKLMLAIRRQHGKQFGRNSNTLKVSFPLSTGFSEVAKLNNEIVSQKNYLLLSCPINPRKYLQNFNIALELVQKNIAKSRVYRKRFLTSFTRDNWVRVHYVQS